MAISPDGKTAYVGQLRLRVRIGNRHRDKPGRRHADPGPGKLLRDRDNPRRHPRLRRERQRRIGHGHRSAGETADRHADPVSKQPVLGDDLPGRHAGLCRLRRRRSHHRRRDEPDRRQPDSAVEPLRECDHPGWEEPLRRQHRRLGGGDRHRDQPADRRADPDGGQPPVGRDLPRRDPRLRARLRRKPDSDHRYGDQTGDRRRFRRPEESNNPNTPPSAPTGRRSSRASSRPARSSASKPPTTS